MSVCPWPWGHPNSWCAFHPPPTPTSGQPHLSPPEQRAALAKIKSQIMGYKTDIERLEKDIERLEKEGKAFEATLSLVVYPVLTLPIEITSRIFVHCLPTHGRVEPSRYAAPLVLAQICHHWRDIAVSTCALWSSMYIRQLGLGWPAGMHSHASMIQTWLLRAKGHPISLGINPGIFTTDRVSRVMADTLVSLIPSFSGQIRRLDLHLWPDQLDRLRQLHLSLPNLHHLEIAHSSDEELRQILEHAPSIRVLRLLGNNPSVNFSLPLLTHLEINADISKETFLAILENFPALSHFKFALAKADSDLISDESIPIALPHLSSLALSSSSDCAALNLLTLPHLHKLELLGFDDEETVLPFLSRSSCTIEHLIISFGQCEEDRDESEITSWLKAFPSVVILEITACSNVNSLTQLFESDGSSLVMRNLKELTICGKIGENAFVDYEDIVTMLRFRRRLYRVAVLRKFHLHLDYPDDLNRWFPGELAAREIQEHFIAAGLDFLITNEGVSWPIDLQIEKDALSRFNELRLASVVSGMW
ncbi:hypothetical protein FB451DRAFT_1568526 [Mycena latifolia]|nr:hypothetical protein FB451DRAFT_1568526 [Mycena latifolia]